MNNELMIERLILVGVTLLKKFLLNAQLIFMLNEPCKNQVA